MLYSPDERHPDLIAAQLKLSAPRTSSGWIGYLFNWAEILRGAGLPSLQSQVEARATHPRHSAALPVSFNPLQ